MPPCGKSQYCICPCPEMNKMHTRIIGRLRTHLIFWGHIYTLKNTTVEVNIKTMPHCFSFRPNEVNNQDMKDVSRRVKSSRRIKYFPPTFNYREPVSSLMQDVSFWSHGPFSPVKGGEEVVFIHRSQTFRKNSSLAHPVQRQALWIQLSNASIKFPSEVSKIQAPSFFFFFAPFPFPTYPFKNHFQVIWTSLILPEKLK